MAKEANVNEVTIFRKFKNKQNLIDATKDYYLQIFLEKIETIFNYDENVEIEEYLRNNFIQLYNLSDEDYSIVKVALEEVSDIEGNKILISKITNTCISKLESFFKIQEEKGNIREVNSTVLAIMCFSITFQSMVLGKVYNKEHDFQEMESNKHAKAFFDILYNGIKS
ncbi:TetR/AcrR family transcriptional regulator [uncultured Methanobrevibacter sp.]|uniref:TetR/AcrR family transcriptional regulator n=1 Tax=uncultured Methanobrevibacter sp. TaxID=253161 RepID=UPI00344E21B5